MNKQDIFLKIISISSWVILLGFLITISLAFTLFLILLLIYHEAGHYALAKREGIYKGWDFGPMMLVVKLKRPFKNRWGYWSGFVGSLPLFFYYISIIKNLSEWYMFFLYALGVAAFDIIPFLFYDRIVKEYNEKKSKE